MRQSVANRAGRAGDIEHRNDSFQFVMAGFVKEVAETDYSYSFSDEVHCQARGRAAEHADHGIQFPSAALQVGASHGEVGAVQGGSRDE